MLVRGIGWLIQNYINNFKDKTIALFELRGGNFLIVAVTHCNGEAVNTISNQGDQSWYSRYNSSNFYTEAFTWISTNAILSGVILFYAFILIFGFNFYVFIVLIFYLIYCLFSPIKGNAFYTRSSGSKPFIYGVWVLEVFSSPLGISLLIGTSLWVCLGCHRVALNSSYMAGGGTPVSLIGVIKTLGGNSWINQVGIFIILFSIITSFMCYWSWWVLKTRGGWDYLVGNYPLLRSSPAILFWVCLARGLVHSMVICVIGQDFDFSPSAMIIFVSTLYQNAWSMGFIILMGGCLMVFGYWAHEEFYWNYLMGDSLVNIGRWILLGVRFSVIGAAGLAIQDNHKNIGGWTSDLGVKLPESGILAGLDYILWLYPIFFVVFYLSWFLINFSMWLPAIYWRQLNDERKWLVDVLGLKILTQVGGLSVVIALGASWGSTYSSHNNLSHRRACDTEDIGWDFPYTEFSVWSTTDNVIFFSDFLVSLGYYTFLCGLFPIMLGLAVYLLLNGCWTKYSAALVGAWFSFIITCKKYDLIAWGVLITIFVFEIGFFIALGIAIT